MSNGPWIKTEEQVKEMDKVVADQRVSKDDLRDIGVVSAMAASILTLYQSMELARMYKTNLDLGYIQSKLDSVNFHLKDIASDIEHRIKENSKNG